MAFGEVLHRSVSMAIEKKETAIPVALGSLDCSLGKLEDVAKHLVTLIDPVLRNEGQEVPNETKGHPPYGVGLADLIQSRADRMANLASALARVVGRVEV